MTTAVAATAATLEQVERALVDGERFASEAGTAFADVPDIQWLDDEALSHERAHALLGRAYLAKRSAEWAVEEAQRAIGRLVFLEQLVDERETFARIDAERSGSVA